MYDYIMKSVLVTGGCGNKGRPLCKWLLDQGYFVVCLDDMSSQSSIYPEEWPTDINIHNERYFVFMYMDCAEIFDYNVKYFGENPQWDLIIHLASSKGDVSHKLKDIITHARFFQWLPKLKHKPQCIVYVSSYDIIKDRKTIFDIGNLSNCIAEVTKETYDINVNILQSPALTCLKEYITTHMHVI